MNEGWYPKPTLEGFFALLHSENKRLGLEPEEPERDEPEPTDEHSSLDEGRSFGYGESYGERNT